MSILGKKIGPGRRGGEGETSTGEIKNGIYKNGELVAPYTNIISRGVKSEEIGQKILGRSANVSHLKNVKDNIEEILIMSTSPSSTPFYDNISSEVYVIEE